MSKRTGAGAYSCHFTPSIASGLCMCNACMNIDLSDSLVAGDSVESNSSNNQLSSFYLISEAFSSHTKKIVEASGGETLYYYLESESATRNLANGMTLETYGHSLGDENYIKDVFETLDPLIDLDFERTYDYSISSFDFYSVWDVWDWNDSTLGQVNDQLDNAYYWDVIWKDAEGSEETSPLDKFIIVHELGHALGLSHPNEQPTNPLWDTNDTVMSYNIAASGYRDWYTAKDIEALKRIWGAEDDHKYYQAVTASTWSDTLLVGRNITGDNIYNQLLQAAQVMPYEWKGPEGSIVNGTTQSEILRGLAGGDIIDGKGGDDLIHGGNGRDIIDGGFGSDELHGDFGWNTYNDQRDGYLDLIAIKSDQLLYNWLYETAGNNLDGRKSDIIEGLDSWDSIVIIGASQDQLSFRDNVSHKGVTGVGIYADGALEALYTGGDLSVNQIMQMTTGDGSLLATTNQMWSYWGDNSSPAVLP